MSGGNSAVECQLPKLDVEGSSPFRRSIFLRIRRADPAAVFFSGLPFICLCVFVTLLAGGCGTTPRGAGSGLPLTLRSELDELRPVERLTSPTTYVVKKGDTLWRIARRYGVEWTAILEANGLTDPEALQPGMRLTIPPAWRPAAAPIGPTEKLPKPRQHVRPAAEKGFIWPVRGTVIGRFGKTRPGQAGVVNRGIDIRVADRTTVRAAKSGQAFRAVRFPGFGKVVVIDHGDGTVTFYGHNAEILVADGARVRQGDTIARAGSTGRPTGPRLHFRILRDHVPADPLRYLPK